MPITGEVRAFLFDVFGTCVDWRTTVTTTLHKQCHATLNDPTASIATAVRLRATDMTFEDWAKFAQEWRNSYKAFTKACAANPDAAWKSVDEHHLDSLRELLRDWNLTGLWLDAQVQTLSRIWHYLTPWPDASAGLAALRSRGFTTATLSNGNVALLEDLRRHAELDFAHVFSAELFGAYKPAPQVYEGAAARLGLRPQQCALVAAHLNDLEAASRCGLRTVYVERPLEEDWEAEQVEKVKSGGWVDLWVEEGREGFVTVAEEVGGVGER